MSQEIEHNDGSGGRANLSAVEPPLTWLPAEADLRRSEVYFRQLFKAAPDAIFITDEAGLIEAVNEQAERMFGYRREELIGQLIEILIPEAPRQRHIAHRRGYSGKPETRATGQGMELAGRRKDGSVLPVAISLSPVRVGEILKVIGTVRDVTQQIRWENELRQRESEMRTLTDNLPDAIVRFDRELRCLFANSSMEKMTGLPRTALLGHSFTEVAALSDMFKPWLVPIRQSLADGQARSAELAINTSTGTRHLDVRLVPEQGIDGTISSVLLIGLDLTDKKNAVAMIRRNEIRMAHSQEVVHFGYWEWNLVTGQRYWSDELFHIFGLDPANFDNTFEAFLEAVHRDDRELVRSTVTTALTDGRHYQLEYRIMRPDGTERTVLEVGDATHNDDGEQIGIEGPIFDMTERKQLQDSIRELKQALEHQVAVRTAELESNSHDLLMPRRAINRLSRILLDEEKELLGRIKLPPDDEGVPE